MTDWIAAMASRMPASRVLRDEALGPRTTYRVGGRASVLVELADAADFVPLIECANRVGAEVLVVGRGSNLLVAERGFDGIVVVLGEPFERVEIEGTRVVAGAAAALPVVARQTVAAGLTGFEWAVGVPGTIGGAIVMNAGGHGSDMAASVVAASVLDLRSGAVRELDCHQLTFGYRSSAIGEADCVLDATIELAPGDPSVGEALIREIVSWRRDNQPGGQNAGSVFTNPEGDSAGRLVDVSGGKGLRVGSAAVSSKHANFIQVDPHGSADDVFELMRAVAALVRSHTGVDLRPETRLVGFGPFTAHELDLPEERP